MQIQVSLVLRENFKERGKERKRAKPAAAQGATFVEELSI
jgi:hypothetical protein